MAREIRAGVGVAVWSVRGDTHSAAARRKYATAALQRAIDAGEVSVDDYVAVARIIDEAMTEYDNQRSRR